MLSSKNIAGMVAVTAASALFLSGCTAFGLVAGIRMDLEHREAEYVLPHQVARIDSGCAVQVFYTDARMTKGITLGMDIMSGEDYARVYGQSSQWSSSQMALPGWHDSVGADVYHGYYSQRIRGRFSGFMADCLVLQEYTGETLDTISLTTLCGLSNARGEPYDWQQIRELIAQRRLPSLQTFVVQTDDGCIAIPLDSIDRVEMKHTPTYFGPAGLLIGAAGDAATILLVSWMIMRSGGLL